MQPNPILNEIRKTRDDMARAAGFDVRKFMDAIRDRERAAAACGVSYASPVPASEESCTVREDPPKP